MTIALAVFLFIIGIVFSANVVGTLVGRYGPLHKAHLPGLSVGVGVAGATFTGGVLLLL